MIQKLLHFKTAIFTRKTLSFVGLSFAVALLLLFFTSRIWMPADNTLSPSVIGTSHQTGSTSIQFKYCKMDVTEKNLIVNIGISDTGIENDTSVSMGAFNSAGGQIEVNIFHQGNGFVLLSVPNAHKEKVIIMAVQVSSLSMDSSVTFKFNILTGQVEQDPFLPLSPSDAECVLLNMKSDLYILEMRLADCKNSIKQNNSFMENAKAKIAELEAQQALQTPEEIEDSNSSISQFRGKIQSLEKKNSELYDELDMVQLQIESKLKTIEEYKELNGL